MKFVFLILSLSSFLAANAKDLEAGRAKSAVCVACHGPLGISTNPIWPNIAGQKELYLADQIKQFRDGKRDNDLMSPISKVLTDEEIANLAAYYASLKASEAK